MRTARSLSPLQQFVSGMLQLRGSAFKVTKEMFCQIVEESTCMEQIMFAYISNKYSLFTNLRYAVCDGNNNVFVFLIFQQEEVSSYGIDWDRPISNKSCT